MTTILDEYTRAVLRRARETYGNINQILVSMGELNELAAACAKYPRYKKHETAVMRTHNEVLDECADVLNSLDHIVNIYGFTDEELRDRAHLKAARLERWIESGPDMEITTVDRDV